MHRSWFAVAKASGLSVKTLVYLHGYNSSAQSHKARLTSEWFAEHHPRLTVNVPQLPDLPRDIERSVDGLLGALDTSGQEFGLIGSSLGGFYANFFAEKYCCKAVLVNPAVYPHKLLGSMLGPHRNEYTGKRFTVDADVIEQLRQSVVETMANPFSRLVLVQKGDEVLDYRDAEHFFAASRLRIESGGDHSFTSYEQWLPEIASFLMT